MYRLLITFWFRDRPEMAPAMNTVELKFNNQNDRECARIAIIERYERDGFSITSVEFDSP